MILTSPFTNTLESIYSEPLLDNIDSFIVALIQIGNCKRYLAGYGLPDLSQGGNRR
jgi:hypothetical protein